MSLSPVLHDKGWSCFNGHKSAIAGGNGTLNKVPRLRPDEPALMERGKGCRMWDVDGNEYIDFRCALGPVTLGYAHPAVNEAIRAQLEKGVVFSHPAEQEFLLAKELIEAIPCAESVRFLKTGGEAVAATIKLARAFTGRNMVLGCGYHGWLNACEDTMGLAHGVRESHRSFDYGDLAAVEGLLREHDGDVAAVVLAGAYAAMEPVDAFPLALRELTERHNVLLIIDEIVTGYRLRLGGYHAFYDFLPDLAVFSKGMANGMPLSVFCGRREIMELAAGKAVVSSTFSGEALSIAAARALLKVYREERVVERLWSAGERMGAGFSEIFRRHGLPVEMKGLAPCKAFVFEAGNRTENLRLQRALFRSFYRYGISMHFICFVNAAHRDEDLAEALERIDAACGDLRLDTEPEPEGLSHPAIGALANLGR